MRGAASGLSHRGPEAEEKSCPTFRQCLHWYRKASLHTATLGSRRLVPAQSPGRGTLAQIWRFGLRPRGCLSRGLRAPFSRGVGRTPVPAPYSGPVGSACDAILLMSPSGHSRRAQQLATWRSTERSRRAQESGAGRFPSVPAPIRRNAGSLGATRAGVRPLRLARPPALLLR